MGLRPTRNELLRPSEMAFFPPQKSQKKRFFFFKVRKTKQKQQQATPAQPQQQRRGLLPFLDRLFGGKKATAGRTQALGKTAQRAQTPEEINRAEAVGLKRLREKKLLIKRATKATKFEFYAKACGEKRLDPFKTFIDGCDWLAKNKPDVFVEESALARKAEEKQAMAKTDDEKKKYHFSVTKFYCKRIVSYYLSLAKPKQP